MTFLNLRNNNLIYILHKDNNVTLETGKVTSVSVPVPKYAGNMYSELVIDISVDTNGSTTNFLKLPANTDIADFGNNMVISCNKDAINSEINAMKLKSLDIINSVNQHELIIKDCDLILELLNPEIAEKLRLELDNKALREEINSLKEMFKEFIIKHYDNDSRSSGK